jgi:C-terminal processing protease CtpA/Prc
MIDCSLTLSILHHHQQEHGAAYEAGGLEVGQLILEVDNTRVEGMQHQVCHESSSSSSSSPLLQ